MWGLMLASTVFLLASATGAPYLDPEWRSLVMHVFSSVCHQLPARSPHVGELPIAVCDRCLGIYVGLVLGVATIGWGRMLWARVQNTDRFVVMGSLVPIGIDWIGPMLGFWSNAPISRAGTGLLFGGVMASFVAYRILAGDERA